MAPVSIGRALLRDACSLSSPTTKMELISSLKFMIWLRERTNLRIALSLKLNTKISFCSSPKILKKSKPARKLSTNQRAASPFRWNTCGKHLSATSPETRACSSQSKTSNRPNWPLPARAKTPGSRPSSRASNAQPPRPKRLSAKTK